MADLAYLEPDGSRRPLTEEEHQKLVREGDSAKLSRVLARDELGDEYRPYRYISSDPPEFRDDGTVVI